MPIFSSTWYSVVGVAIDMILRSESIYAMRNASSRPGQFLGSTASVNSDLVDAQVTGALGYNNNSDNNNNNNDTIIIILNNCACCHHAQTVLVSSTLSDVSSSDTNTSVGCFTSSSFSCSVTAFLSGMSS